MSFSVISFTSSSFTIHPVSAWVVPILEHDFDKDIEDMVIEHIYNKWSISDPAKPAAMVADDAPIQFRPGFLNYATPYEITALQTLTRAQKKTGMNYVMLTDVPITIRARRLTTDEDPTKPLQYLGIMEEEVRRIVLAYLPNDYVGIDRLIYDGVERLYNPDDTYAKAEWISTTRIGVLYQKEDLT